MRIPIDISELAVEKHLARDRNGEPVHDATIESLAQSVRSAREAAEALAAYHRTLAADRSRSADQRAIELRAKAVKTAEVQARKIDAVRSRAMAEIERITREIHSPPPPDAATAGEVRSVLRSMRPEQAREAVMDAVRRGDDLTLGAVLAAGIPGYLAGIGDALIAGVRDTWQRQRFPAEHDRLGRLRKAAEAQERAARSFLGMVRGMVGGEAERIAEAAENASLAGAALDQHLVKENVA